jgi:hypothetical protein
VLALFGLPRCRRWLLFITSVLFASGCPEPKKPIEPASFFGVYRFTRAGSAPSIKVGTLLRISQTEFAVQTGEAWARLPVTWATPGPGELYGKTQWSTVVVRPSGENGIVVNEDGKELGAALLLSGAEADAVAKQLDALPGFQETVERATKCIARFNALLPGDKTFDGVDPARLNTSSSLGMLDLAESRLLERCTRVPAECVHETSNEVVREKRKSAGANCRDWQ